MNQGAEGSHRFFKWPDGSIFRNKHGHRRNNLLLSGDGDISYLELLANPRRRRRSAQVWLCSSQRSTLKVGLSMRPRARTLVHATPIPGQGPSKRRALSGFSSRRDGRPGVFLAAGLCLIYALRSRRRSCRTREHVGSGALLISAVRSPTAAVGATAPRTNSRRRHGRDLRSRRR